MPIVIDGKIRAFTYADNDHEPFSLEAVSQLFETCQNAVEHKDPSAVFERPKRSRRKSSSHFETCSMATQDVFALKLHRVVLA